ncbi:helix-turn-helix domain-containing protein [Pseudomonas putida]|nr:helix-turn-helix domain-containing protein [Pseudomonas putida]
MSTQYNHLSTEERVTIMVMLFQRQPLRAIAALLGRHPSTISREIRRNPQ